MKMLITGTKGFIGSNLIKEVIPAETKIYAGDILRLKKVPGRIDWIVHLAAETNPRDSDNLNMHRVNVQGFLNIIDLALRKKAGIIYASSAAQYGSYRKTAYAKSKAIMDMIAEDFFDKLHIVGLRLVNVFGPGENRKGKTATMITQWAIQLLAGKRPRAFLEERKTRRDYVYVKDVVKAIVWAPNLKSGFYDVGNGAPKSFDQVLDLVQKTLKIHRKPIYIPNPYKGRYQKYTKAKLNWGFKPDFTFEEGIKDYLGNEDCQKDLGRRAMGL